MSMTPWNPTVFGKNLPKECRDKISEFQKAEQKILCVAFPPEGGNRWSVITDQTFFNRNIPDECHQKMLEFQNAGHKVIWAAFPPAGGNRWSVITNKGAFFNRGADDRGKDPQVAPEGVEHPAVDRDDLGQGTSAPHQRHPPERVHVRRASGGGGGGDQHGRQGKRQLQEHQLRARADRHGVPGRAQDQRRRPRHRDGRTVHCVLPDEHLRSAGDPGCRVEAGCGRADRVLPGAAGELGGTSYGDWSLKPGSAGVHLSLAELSIFVEKLATTNILLPQPMRAQMDSEGLGLGKHGSGKGEYYSKGGYFPGSMNGGAELHSAIYKYTNGVQLAIVYNGEGNKSKLDVEKAYDEAWK